MLQPGDQAPDFALQSTEGIFTLSATQGQQHVLVIFYPMDNTPG